MSNIDFLKLLGPKELTAEQHQSLIDVIELYKATLSNTNNVYTNWKEATERWRNYYSQICKRYDEAVASNNRDAVYNYSLQLKVVHKMLTSLENLYNNVAELQSVCMDSVTMLEKQYESVKEQTGSAPTIKN